MPKLTIANNAKIAKESKLKAYRRRFAVFREAVKIAVSSRASCKRASSLSFFTIFKSESSSSQKTDSSAWILRGRPSGN